MRRTKNYFTGFALLFICLHTSSVHAQEMLGAANSNYSGTSSLMLNPSTFVDNRLALDITLLAGGFSIDNDYVYFPKGTVHFPGFSDISSLSDDRKFSDVKNYSNH